MTDASHSMRAGRLARWVAALAASLWLGSCATRPAAPDAFIFGVMGDAPYNAREEAPFLAMIGAMSAEPLAFVVHVGDIKAGGNSPCTDALYEKRRAELDRLAHPLIYTPGDNEWTDCRRASNGGMDPVERLAKLRGIFFSDQWSLGARRIATAFQSECLERRGESCACGPFPENRAWTQGGVRFVTLNFPGKSNNEGYDSASDEEARCRTEANRRWLERAVDASAAPDTRALVIATQANPWVGRRSAYDPLLRQVERAALRLRKPVLFVHGDTHIYRVDTPFVDSGGAPIPRLTRLETYGSPFVGWVRVSVDPDKPDLFTFEPKLQAIVPP